MAFLILVFLFGLCGLFRYFEKRAAEAQPPVPPMGAMVAEAAARAAPGAHPSLDMQEMRAAEDRILHQYAWIDPDKGIVRIPVDRAMDLILAKGFAAGAAPTGRAGAQPPPERYHPEDAMIPRKIVFISLFSIAAVWAQPGQPAPAQPSAMRDSNSKPAPLPAGLRGVNIEQRLNQQVPLDLVFRDEFGRSLPLSTYFSGNKPVLLALVYYNCPMLCTLILNGMESSLKAVSLDPGRDFEVVAVSFDPRDTPEIAARKKANYLQRYRRPDTANGWHFLTGDEAIHQSAYRGSRLPI